ncbi:MAG: hypothetical protein MR902_07695 [Campylobacter sp.]|nr:hypothetical protein [Campylobacter sp.]
MVFLFGDIHGRNEIFKITNEKIYKLIQFHKKRLCYNLWKFWSVLGERT